MKKILSAFLLFSFTLSAQVPDEVHKKCKDVADYVGCVQIFTGSVITKKETAIPEVKELKKALGLLPSRLQNTSLRDFSNSIRPFTDALASAKAVESMEDYSSEEKKEIQKITSPSIILEGLVEVYRGSIADRIYLEVNFKRFSRVCARISGSPDSFNILYKKNVIRFIEQTSTFGFYICETNSWSAYEGLMLSYIIEASKNIAKDLNPFPEISEYVSYDSLRLQAYDKNQKIFAKYEGLESEIENNWSKTDREEGKKSKYTKWQKKMHLMLEESGGLWPQENLLSIPGRFTSFILWYPSATAEQISEMENLMREVQHYIFPDRKYSPKYHNEYIYEHYKMYLAGSYYNLSSGDRKANLLAAEKLLISFLGSGWNNFKTCSWTLGDIDDVYAACVENMSSALRMHERIKKELNQLAI